MPWFGSSAHVYSGFPGDLSVEQEQVLKDFKEHILKNSLSDPRFDDYYLLRFCRARKFNLAKTIEMFEAMIAWRKQYDVENCVSIYKCPNLAAMKKIYKHCWHKTDKIGRPIWMEQTCTFEMDDLLKVITRDEIYQHYIRVYEELIHIVFPACSKAYGASAAHTFSLIDINGFSMEHMKSKSKDIIQIALKISDDYYPEVLGQMILINAPFIFRSAWAMIKPFVDSRTREKIKFIGSDYTDTLLEYVSPDSLPKEYGGECTCDNCPDG